MPNELLPPGEPTHSHRELNRLVGAGAVRKGGGDACVAHVPPHPIPSVILRWLVSDYRSCPLRTQCQGHGTSTKKTRRVSAVLHPQPQSAPHKHPPPCLPATR